MSKSMISNHKILTCFDPFPYACDVAVVSWISPVEQVPLVSKFWILEFRYKVLQRFHHLVRQFVRSWFDSEADVGLQGSFGHALLG